MTGLYFLSESSMPKYLQSTKLNKILTELHYLQFLRSISQQRLTIIAAYISDYIETITLNARTFVPRKSADFRATRRSWITRSPGIPKFALRLPKHNWQQRWNHRGSRHNLFIHCGWLHCAHHVYTVHITFTLCTLRLHCAHHVYTVHITFTLCTLRLHCAHHVSTVHITS